MKHSREFTLHVTKVMTFEDGEHPVEAELLKGTERVALITPYGCGVLDPMQDGEQVAVTFRKRGAKRPFAGVALGKSRKRSYP